MWTIAVLCALAFSAVMAGQEDDMFVSFMYAHGKSYKNAREYHYRKNVFTFNFNYIAKHNEIAASNRHSHTLAMNEFGDMTNYEFRMLMNGYRQTPEFEARSNHQVYRRTVSKLPDEVDWRSKGYVTPVKNQGQCGSCWAFSTTGSLEGQHFNATGKLVSLSEQNLVDCSGKYGNHGCQGGLMDNAFRYVIANHGIDSELAYPYDAVQQQCVYSAKSIGSICNGFRDVQVGSEAALQAAVAEVGPVSVAIDASHTSFQFYHTGVYNEAACSPTKLDHGVLVVGYGNDDGTDYWLVKNSWSAKWGDEGYIKMSRNRQNQCGIATSASFPIVQS